MRTLAVAVILILAVLSVGSSAAPTDTKQGNLAPDPNSAGQPAAPQNDKSSASSSNVKVTNNAEPTDENSVTSSAGGHIVHVHVTNHNIVSVGGSGASLPANKPTAASQPNAELVLPSTDGPTSSHRTENSATANDAINKAINQVSEFQKLIDAKKYSDALKACLDCDKLLSGATALINADRLKVSDPLAKLFLDELSAKAVKTQQVLDTLQQKLKEATEQANKANAEGAAQQQKEASGAAASQESASGSVASGSSASGSSSSGSDSSSSASGASASGSNSGSGSSSNSGSSASGSRSSSSSSS